MSSASGIWKSAILFELKNWRYTLLPIPIVLMPFVTDLYKTCIISQSMQGQPIDFIAAIKQSLRQAPGLISIKFCFALIPLLLVSIPILISLLITYLLLNHRVLNQELLVLVTAALALLPSIYGTIKAYQYRIAWGMASNILILEAAKHQNYLGKIKRCIELRKIDTGLGLRTLIIIPSILIGSPFLLLILSESVPPLLLMGLMWFLQWLIIFPLSATVNTFYYLAVTADDQLSRETTQGDDSSHSRMA